MTIVMLLFYFVFSAFLGLASAISVCVLASPEKPECTKRLRFLSQVLLAMVSGALIGNFLKFILN